MPAAHSRTLFRHSAARLATILLMLAVLAVPAATFAGPVPSEARAVTAAELAELRADLRAIAASQEPPAAPASAERPWALGGPERASVVVELTAPSAIEVYSAASQRGFARAAERAAEQVETVELQQDRVAAALALAAPEAAEIYRVQRVYNGIALSVDPASLERIAAIPGVTAIHPLVPKELDNGAGVPLIGAPGVWAGAGLGATGEGIDIGIIDTGIDYIHTGFGGPGTDAYAANNTLVVNDTYNGAPLFPTAKVVGGYDFAGDDYNAGDPDASTPAPDPDPMDCNGHGSHVAGTAAGYGVNTDGSTFGGPYDGNVPFSTMRIGPGVAPRANLYALRVFGCGGSTNLTDEAIEWATDPNGDGDFSDRLDVINMSLGSSFGSAFDLSAVASDRAAELGVVVVTSAGNSSDTYYITGSPGAATRALSVASSVDAVDVVDGFNVTSASLNGVQAATFSANFNWAASSPLSAALVYDAAYNGCAAATAGQAAAFNGKVVLVDWAPAGSSTFPCGSAVRANNLTAAGAAGVIIASGLPSFDTSISGNAAIRAVYTTYTVGQALKTALGGGAVTIGLSNAYRNAGRFEQPGNIDTLSSFSSRGPRRGDSALKPDITMPGQSIFSVATGTGNAGRSLNGTSMAAPHAAGMMALMRQLRPTWTVEELKALAINTASNDLFTGTNLSGTTYGPGRIGSGRGGAVAAATSQVVAYNAGTSGAVSVSFGFVEVPVGPILTQTRTVRIANKGNAAATYNVEYVGRVDSPGVTITVAPPSVTVPAGGTAEVTVVLSADPSQMKRGARDATVAATALGFNRHWLGEEAGFVQLTSVGVPTLRVPVHAAPRIAATLGAVASGITMPDATGTIPAELAGDGVATAPVASLGDPAEEFSLVSALELQAVSPALTTTGLIGSADISHVGVMSNIAQQATVPNTTVFFGIAAHKPFTLGSAGDTEFDIYIDTNNSGLTINQSGGTVGAEYVLFNWNEGSRTNVGANDVFVSTLANLSTGVTARVGFTNGANANTNTNIFNNNVLVLSVPAASLGLTGASSRINYRVVSFHREATGVVDATGVMTYDVATPGLSAPAVTYLAAAGASNAPQVGYDRARFESAFSRGLLLLHHHNSATAGRAEALLAPVDLAVSLSGPSRLFVGTTGIFTATVSNSSPRAVDNVELNIPLPAGITLADSALVSPTQAGGKPCSVVAGAIDCALGTLGVSGSVSVRLSLAATAPGNVQLAASVTSDAADPSLANNTSALGVTLPGLVVTQSGGTTAVVEGATPDTYTVALGSAPTGDVTVTVTPDARLNLGAGAGAAITLTFTPANWNTPQTVTVAAVQDATVQGTTLSTIAHTATGGGYTGLASANLAVTVSDKFYVNLPLIRK